MPKTKLEGKIVRIDTIETEKEGETTTKKRYTIGDIDKTFKASLAFPEEADIGDEGEDVVITIERPQSRLEEGEK